MIDHPIIGAWSLQRWRIRRSDGRESHPYGEEPQGRLLYSADGQMLAAIARRERTILSAAVPRQAPAEEKAAAFDSYFSYGGRFEIRGEQVIHHVDIALNPNFVGTQQVRDMHFDGDTLTLSATDGERRHELVWKRIGR